MGALTYRPVIPMESGQEKMTLDEIAGKCERILNTDCDDGLDYLYSLGGSSGRGKTENINKNRK